MKRVLFTAVLVSFFIGTTVLSGLAASEHEAHQSGSESAAATTSSPGMMMQQGTGKAQMPCMAATASGSMSQMKGMMGEGMDEMMGAGKMGMMGMLEQRMVHMFYLDRADELGLSPEQISKLKALHSDCRKDNIRNVAEAKIARLDLADLLPRNNWALKDAEPLVRKVQKLEGDIQVRHLKALSDARKVLTTEQQQKARSGDSSGNLERLFQ